MSSQRHHRMTTKRPERFRYGREARASLRLPIRVLWSYLLILCVVGMPTGQTGHAEPRKGWKSVHYKDLSFDIPEDFLVQQGRVPLLSFIAVFFWSSWAAPRPLMFAAVLDQSGPNLMPEEGFLEVLQRFQLDNAFMFTVPRIGGFEFDPATIQVSEYVALGAPVREVRAHLQESGVYYRLYILVYTLATDTTIRNYLAVVGCAEERLTEEHGVLRTILTSLKLH